jgi:hypothetical protein
MEINKTVVEWAYEPSSFFEGSMIFSEEKYNIKLENGLVHVTLATPQNPVSSELLNEIKERLEVIFMARGLYTHKTFKIKGYSINQIRQDGSKDAQIIIGNGVMAIGCTFQADIITKDKDGKVIYDSKAVRIAEQFEQIEFILKRTGKSDQIKSLLDSYSRAVFDPADELVHLYEIREALSKELGGEENAVRMLGISKNRWKRLGILANIEPLEQGRHRGKHEVRRAASNQEIQEARDIARELITLYTQSL